MKDLDFDELDRAVNSVITNKSVPTDDINTESLLQPVVSAPVTTSVPFVSVAPRPSTGRFMDVVHPSSDMRTTLVMPERTRNQVSVMPIAKPPMAQTVMTTDKDDDSDIDQISNDINKTLGQTFSEPQDSPFLSGTKVEKRPLGAFSAEQSASTSFQPTTLMNRFDQTDKVTNGKLVEINTPLPAELQSDLLTIEANEMVQPEDTTNVTDVPKDEAPKDIISSPVINPKPVQIADSDPISTPVLVPATSIPQQYAEKPSTGDKDNGAIYDTKAYHTAMVSPAKKKSGWMWIVWIALLMVVSVGAGVAVYFLVLPHL